jgi:hypothetical protein
MEMFHRSGVPLMVCLLGITLHTGDAPACTTGTAMGAATADGRPIAWHNEDLKPAYRTPRLVRETAGKYDAIIVQTGNGWGRGGLNEQGLARFINNQTAIGDWGCDALGQISRSFASLAEVRSYLGSKGCNTCVSTPVIDRHGKAAMFEIGNGNDYWEYNPENPLRQQQPHFASPKLFAVRSNRAFTNDDHQEPDAVVAGWPDGNSSKLRYLRAREMFTRGITDSDRLTMEEVMEISRDGNPGLEPSAICRASTYHTIWGVIAFGVKSGEDPKYAVMFVALGNPDYSIYVPVWVDLAAGELSAHLKSWSDSWTEANANNIGWWAAKLFDEHFDQSADYDEYLNDLFDDVEKNIVSGVKQARRHWLDLGRSGRFHDQALKLHDWSARAAFETVKAAHQTAGTSGRGCNRPPRITTLGPSASGLGVTFRSDASDPDGDGIATYSWDFGDGQSAINAQGATITHTYAQAGSYMVSHYARDDRAHPAANVRFEFVTVAAANVLDAGAIADATTADGAQPVDGGAGTDGETPRDAGSQADGPALADAGPRPDLTQGPRDAGAVDPGPELQGGCNLASPAKSPMVPLAWLALLLLILTHRARPARR